MKVTVWATTALPSMVTDAQSFTSALNELGYRATLRTIATLGKYFSFTANSDNRIQASGNGWISDYPAPSNFMDIMRCSRFLPGSSQNLNFPELCDHGLDRLIEHALSVQTTDPAGANELWTAIDRRVTDDAPWVFTINPSGLDFVASRVGNYQHNPQWGILVDQLWVK
jgi:peptide/nickel transport system substrate-binding protein